MIVLYILLAVILFIALLLSLNLKLYIKLDDVATIHVGFGPIVIQIAPKKPRKPVALSDFTYEKHQKRLIRDRKLAEKKAAKQSAKIEKKRQQKAMEEKAKQTATAVNEAEDENKLFSIIELLSFIFDELPKFFSCFQAEIRMLDISVGGKDADCIARNYGKISALVSLLIELLDNKTRLKKLKPNSVQVRADFVSEKIKYRLNIHIKLRLFSIVCVGFDAIKWFIKQKISKMKA